MRYPITRLDALESSQYVAARLWQRSSFSNHGLNSVAEMNHPVKVKLGKWVD
jgi:hypothetical protein